MNMPLIQKSAQKTETTKGLPRSGSRKPEVLGVTKDGVKILRPTHKATNFTAKEAHEAVARALGKSA